MDLMTILQTETSEEIFTYKFVFVSRIKSNARNVFKRIMYLLLL